MENYLVNAENPELHEIEELTFETVKAQNNKKNSKIIFEKITDRDLHRATKWDDLGLEYVGG